jgi:arylsulfatase A-like enzyme
MMASAKNKKHNGSRSSERPNFIIIHTDQQRGDCLGIGGRHPGLFTPHIDSLANAGARFTAAYSTCPVCIPQRMTLMTGQLAATHGVLWNVGIPDFPFTHTLPGELSAAGYQTALVGRTMHLRPENRRYGFEYYMPGDPSSSDKTEDPFFKWLEHTAPEGSGGYYGNGTGNNSYYGAPFHLPDYMHHTFWTTTQALDFLAQRDESRPFMLCVGYYAPHGPQNPPASFFDRYYYREDLRSPAVGDWAVPPVAETSVSSTPYVDLQGELLRACRAGYYGNISFIDAQLGRLLPKIDWRNTYVIFTSDHGELLGDHYLYHKCTGYEGSAHIPMTMTGPGIEALTLREEPVGWHDILPTVFDYAGLDIPADVDGASMRPLLEGAADPKWRRHLSGECTWKIVTDLPGQNKEDNRYYDGGHHFITDGKRKFLWHPASGAEQFFDLEEDPDECRNLASSPKRQEETAFWRRELARVLSGRPEGFSDGSTLISGTPMRRLMPHGKEICDRRIEEGYRILYYYEPRIKG